MTVRLSHSSLTGTERTEVAVGTVERGVHVLGGAGRGAAQHGVGRLVAWPARARPGGTPWAPGWWCPWPARRPWSPGAASRPARASASGPARARPALGRLRGAAAGPAWLGGSARLRSRPARPSACRWPPCGVAAVASGSTSPTSGRRCRGPPGTGRTSPPRATRWRRSRRTGRSDWLPGDCGTAWFASSGTCAGECSVVKARPPHQQMQD